MIIYHAEMAGKLKVIKVLVRAMIANEELKQFCTGMHYRKGCTII
jgi:hypothetical protein